MVNPTLKAVLRRPLGWLLGPLRDQRPASRLIRTTARQQWKLLSLNVVSNLAVAVTEGATLAVIYLAVEWLSHPGEAAGLLPPALAQLMAQVPSALLFVGLMGLALLLQTGQSLASYINRICVEYFAGRCQALVTARIHRQILAFSYACASRYRVGDLSDQLAQGPGAVTLQIDMVNQLGVGVLMVMVYLAVLLRLSPWLMLAALVLGGLIALIQKQLLPRIREEAWRANRTGVEVTSRIIEHIQGLRLLHTSGQLDQACDQLAVPLGVMERCRRRSSRLSQVIEPVSRLLPVLAFVVIASLSTVVFKDRSAGVLPNLVTFMLALQRLNARLSGMALCSNAFSENIPRLDRLNHILEPAGKQFRRQGGLPFQRLEREIRFDRVRLRYAAELAPALDGISFTLPKGRTLALVGSSGAGKSSIADLLVGLYDPTDGRILIDGMDLSRLDLASWQQTLGVVSQDTFLFNGTLAENIAFGCPWATAADVAVAAARAQAAGFIAELPEGYDTPVGERGYRLSGGQRQRISLARALLRRPELLILDEATSALDSESERLVQQAIEAFEAGEQTVLVIAHRLSTVMNADQILVLEKGRIVERGTHAQLLGTRGRYCRLWTQQAGCHPSASPEPQVV